MIYSSLVNSQCSDLIPLIATAVAKRPKTETAGSAHNRNPRYREIANAAAVWDIQGEPGFPSEAETQAVYDRIVNRRRDGGQVGAQNEAMQSAVFVDHMYEVLADFGDMTYTQGSAYASDHHQLHGVDDFKVQEHAQDVITGEWKKPSTLPRRTHWSHISAQVLGPLDAQRVDCPWAEEAISLVGNGVDWQVVAETADSLKWAGHFDSYSHLLVQVLVFIMQRVKAQRDNWNADSHNDDTSQEDSVGTDEDHKNDEHKDEANDGARGERAQRRANRKLSKGNNDPKSGGGLLDSTFHDLVFHASRTRLDALLGGEERFWEKIHRREAYHVF